VAQRSRGINVWQSGIGGLILINVLLTFAIPGISIGGHLGGLIGGFITGTAVSALEQRTRSPWAGVASVGALSVVFFAGSIWAANYAVETGSAVLSF
jgi:hypothetical protein